MKPVAAAQIPALIALLIYWSRSRTGPGIDDAVCRPTGFENVISCSSIPSVAQTTNNTITLQNNFQTFDWMGARFIQLDLASYLFFKNPVAAYGTQARHPFLLLATTKSPLGSDVLEVSANNRFGFHLAIDRGSYKPRTAQRARQKGIRGFKRERMCYTSATPKQIAAAITEFSESGKGYKLFKNNCYHFVLHMLERFCGQAKVRLARIRLFNLGMLVGSRMPQSPRQRLQSLEPQPPIPVVFVPAESSKNNDSRQLLINVKEIMQVFEPISTGRRPKYNSYLRR
jgi:hypothetical protein